MLDISDHMDEATPYLHIDFIPYTTGSKQGLEIRVSLKKALAELGFKGGTRSETECNQWVAAEKERLAEIMLQHGIEWEKKERQKEVAELEQTISGSKEKLSDILHQQIAAGRETEQIRQEINKMLQSKEVMERNIHAYDEDVKWQLAEPGALMSAKAYRDKKALPLVEKLKEVVKNLTIKCVQLTEQGKKLTAKVDGQKKQISRLTDKVMEQSDTIDRLQEKASDFGRLERHFGREQVQSIVERSKALEQAERAKKRSKRTFEMSR